MARAQLQFWTKKRPGVANKKKVMVSKKNGLLLFYVSLEWFLAPWSLP